MDQTVHQAQAHKTSPPQGIPIHTCEVVHPSRGPQQVIIEAGAVESHQGTAPVVVLGPLTQLGCCVSDIAAYQAFAVQGGACVCEPCCVRPQTPCCLHHSIVKQDL